ncbi:glycerol-3-phosphate dehydrogenase/oxidase [Oceanobacillus jeddahense]|uniref:glycerol-3-phosphate dehydrogenase/oxidase n=1 Tax=Oceanobacillus jeddahense TaxID=1462527 RepID=UPI0006941680|nr:glycerol-3-phosphate dehydrogenase/oxidase [Oceanobacillus jeddahense]
MSIHPFSKQGRENALAYIGNNKVDLLIIGGGITGCGIARDAALRGLKVALVEKEDFGYGTSSRSSKLVHGGVRYLANGDIPMVRESARERKVLKTIAPHLVHRLPFIFPLYKGEVMTKFRAGFFLFDKLAGVSEEEKHRILTEKELKAAVPGIRDDAKGGVIFAEYITDDARFTAMNALSAAENGAYIANHTSMIQLLEENNKVIGAKIRDELNEKEYMVSATVTINATGPWATENLIKTQHTPPKDLLLSKGIHFVFSADKIPLESAVSLKAPSGKEGFAIRRWNYVYIGTTDIQHNNKIDEPSADEAAIEELLQMVKDCFPTIDINRSDILGTWAGLRPLILEKEKNTREISRHDEIWKMKEGLYTIAGGKLTTYRCMANRVMETIAKDLNISDKENMKTREVVLPGGDIGEDIQTFKQETTAQLIANGVSTETAERLIWLYGSRVMHFINYGEESTVWLEPLAEGIPAIKAEVRLAVEQEMAHTINDFMDRRSALLIFSPNHGLSAVETVANIMGDLLQWTESQKTNYISKYVKRASEHNIPNIKTQ